MHAHSKETVQKPLTSPEGARQFMKDLARSLEEDSRKRVFDTHRIEQGRALSILGNQIVGAEKS